MICRWAIAASLLWLPAVVFSQEVTVGQRHATAVAEFISQLDALAAEYQGQQMLDEAQRTRDWIAPRRSGRQTLFVSGGDREPKLASGAPAKSKQWLAKFLLLRREYAAKTYALAAEAAGDQQGELALRLVYETVHEDPGHAEARSFLSLERPAVRTPKARSVSGIHPQFGWRSGRHYLLETDHFKIETDSSPKTCNELGQALEQLHDVCRQVYFPLWGEDRIVAARFSNKEAELSERKRFHVVLFKDRDEYVKQLGKPGKAASISSGFYSDEEQMSLFYAGEDAKESTRYHEVTHQLIQEYLDARPGVAKEHNVWMVEAAALYMESLVLGDGYALLGGYDSDNLQFARFRARGGDFQMPLAELSLLGRDALQGHPEIRKIYSQMGGLGQFFMEGRNGELRGPFLDTLLDVYRGKADANALVTASKTSFDDLDRQYLDFLDVSDEMIARAPPLPSVGGLSLRKTQVTDAGLAAFGKCDKLQWLDLSLTAAGDSGFAAFPVTKTLKTLFLEGTTIGDASLEHVAEFTNLEELYLSNTSLSDEGIANLNRLKKLKTLDLSGCPLTDSCLAALAPLTQLESLDTAGTRITPEGLARLKRSLPKLKN
jgi:hypothetical protein